jgi:hypothetical protein
MSIGLFYLLYLLISLGLTFLTGRALTRNGRLFLLDGPGGNDGAAESLSNLLVVAFYLLALGFVALTMRAAGDVATGRQAAQLLAAKLGYVLLVLGGLYLASIAVLTRLRRRARLAFTGRAPASPTRPGLPAAARRAGRAAAWPAAPAVAERVPDSGLAQRVTEAGPPGRMGGGEPATRVADEPATRVADEPAARVADDQAARVADASSAQREAAQPAGAGRTTASLAGTGGPVGPAGERAVPGRPAVPGRLGPGQPLWRPGRKVS